MASQNSSQDDHTCKVTVQLFWDEKNKGHLHALLDILLANCVAVTIITDINAVKIDAPTIFVISEGMDKEIEENKLVKDINDKGFKKVAMIVPFKISNADVTDLSNSPERNIRVFQLAIHIDEDVGKAEDSNQVLNELLIYIETKNGDDQSLLRSTPSSCSSFSRFFSKKLGPVQVYCKRNDQTATDITGDFVSHLRNKKFDCNIKYTNDLNHAEPAIVICFKTSRILANVSEGVVDIKNKLTDKKVLIILHLTERVVETVDDAGADLLDGYEYYSSLGMILDMTYRNDEHQSRFCLNQNAQAFKKLECYLKELHKKLLYI